MQFYNKYFISQYIVWRSLQWLKYDPARNQTRPQPPDHVLLVLIRSVALLLKYLVHTNFASMLKCLHDK